MKIFTTLLTALVLCTTSYAQQHDLEELLQRLDQNHMGSILDVFTVSEIETLNAHFEPLRQKTNAIERQNHSAFFATENVDENFTSTDGDLPSVISVIAGAAADEFEGAGAVKPGTNRALIVDNGNNIYTITSNGIYFDKGEIFLPMGESITGIEYSEDGSVLYALASDGSTTTLYEINQITYEATPVGPTGLVIGISIARDADGNLYTYDIDDDKVYQINRTNGGATELFPLSFDASFAQGMNYNPLDGKIYLTAFNNDAFISELRVLDIANNTTELIGQLGTTTVQMGWMGFYDPTLGINTVETNNFLVYPNPASDRLRIEATTQLTEATVYSILGEKLFTTSLQGLQATLNIATLQTGTYLVKLQSEAGQETLKFIKH